jgi:hypothetical protein
MNDIKIILYCLALCIFAGCAEIPKSAQRLEVHKNFNNSSFKTVWSSSIKTMESLKGTIIAKDEVAGLITCKIGKKKELTQYVNIYIRTDYINNLCEVYILPHTFSTYSSYSFPKNSKEKIMFNFKDVYSKKDSLSTIGQTIFKKMENNLRGSNL